VKIQVKAKKKSLPKKKIHGSKPLKNISKKVFKSSSEKAVVKHSPLAKPSVNKKVVLQKIPAKAPSKTHLSAKQSTHYEDLLLATKSKILRNIDNIETQNLGSHKDSSGDLSGYSLHMADVGTDNYDRELALNMVGNEQEIIYQIDDALERIKNGTYGICAMLGHPIPTVRLDAIPWTAYCKEAQEKLEKEKKGRG
jgi:RNA polymerase-binding transcription factor DksA